MVLIFFSRKRCAVFDKCMYMRGYGIADMPGGGNVCRGAVV